MALIRDNDGKEGADDIAKSLKRSGIDNVQVTDQHCHNVSIADQNYNFHNYGKGSFSESDQIKTKNRPKLVVTVPDTLDSVLQIKAAYRDSVVAVATESVKTGIDHARDLVEKLGATEKDFAMHEVLGNAGVTAVTGKAKG